MDEVRPTRKLPKLKFFNDARLIFWVIPEIYGWLIILLGFGIFGMLFVAAVAYLFEAGFSVDALFSLVQLLEGIAIGGGFVAFGVALRRFITVQFVLCIILFLITVWFVYFFSFFGQSNDAYKSIFLGIVLIFPLALCVYLNRERFKIKSEPAIKEAENSLCEFGKKMSLENYLEILQICEKGDSFFVKENFHKAIESYAKALKIVPEPPEEHDAATWIQTMIGDSYFSQKMYQDAINIFLSASKNPKSEKVPFLQMRLGQSFYETGDFQNAALAFQTAFDYGGGEIFFGEKPKYLLFLKKILVTA